MHVGDSIYGVIDKMTATARRLVRKGWTFRFARAEREKETATNLFRLVDGVAKDATFDGEILVAESPRHRIAGAALLTGWTEGDRVYCMIRVLAVAPDKRGRGVGTALLWAARRAAHRADMIFGGCSSAGEGFYRAVGCEIRAYDAGNGMISANPLYDRWFVLPRED